MKIPCKLQIKLKTNSCYEMKKKYKKCEICRNTNDKYLLARFPLDKERCKKWVKAIGIPELARLSVAQLHYAHFVCGKHFSENQFRSKNSRLKITAIPTLHLLNPPLSDTLLENFPVKKHLPNTITVTLHVENGVKTAIAPHNFMAEHNYFQRIDPSKCDTIAQTDIVAEDKKSHSTPICSSAVDMSENETRKEMTIENPGATTAETDADNVTDYSAPRVRLNVNKIDVRDPTPSSVQSDVANHSSNVTITNPGPTPSSVQSAVANHSPNVTITNQGPTSSSVQSAVTNHSFKYYYYLTNPGPTPSSVQSAVANHSSNVNITNPGPTPSSVQSAVANHSSNVTIMNQDPTTSSILSTILNLPKLAKPTSKSMRKLPGPTPSSVQSAVANHSSNVNITNPGPTPSSVQSAVANHSSNVTITNQGPTSSSVQSAVANHSFKYYYYLTNPGPTPSSVQSAVANHSSNVNITNPGPTPSSVQSAVANHSSNVTITNQGPTPSSVQSAVANHSSNVTITNQDPTTSSILSTMAKPTSKSMRKLPVTKVDNEEIKKLRADLVKQYRKKAAQKLKETRTKLREAQKKLWAIESIKSPLLKSLIETEISNRKKKAKGKRWSTFTKCLALALYKRSSQAYTYLEKLLPLPTIRTLQKTFQEYQQGAALSALEQLQPQTEDFQADDTLVFPSADTIVEPLPYEE